MNAKTIVVGFAAVVAFAVIGILLMQADRWNRLSISERERLTTVRSEILTAPQDSLVLFRDSTSVYFLRRGWAGRVYVREDNLRQWQPFPLTINNLKRVERIIPVDSESYPRALPEEMEPIRYVVTGGFQGIRRAFVLTSIKL